jgi:hypothetical protein
MTKEAAIPMPIAAPVLSSRLVDTKSGVSAKLELEDSDEVVLEMLFAGDAVIMLETVAGSRALVDLLATPFLDAEVGTADEYFEDAG